MIDEIAPVQFIEGLNENSKANDYSYINTSGYSLFAISYEPQVTYTLVALSIFIIQAGLNDKPRQFELSLRTDYANNPSDIKLSKASWESTSNYIDNWQYIELDKPVVIIKGKRYWYVLELGNNRVSLPIANDEIGIVSDIRVMGRLHWNIEKNFPKNKAMMQFFGRVIPILT